MFREVVSDPVAAVERELDTVRRATNAGPSSSDGSLRRELLKTFAADLASSWGCFSVSMLFAHPIDTLRIRWQTQGRAPLETIRADGVRNLFAGITAPMLAMGPTIAGTFATFEYVKGALRRRGWLRHASNDFSSAEPGRLPTLFAPLPSTGFSLAEAFAAGSVSGMLAAQFLCPVTVVRVQQQHIAGLDGQGPVAASTVARKLWKQEGLAGLYRGNLLVTVGGGVGRGVYFASYDAAKHVVRGTSLNGHASGDVAAALAATVVWLVYVFPVDFVSTKLQTDKIAPRHEQEFGGLARRVVRQTLKEQGVRGMFSGFQLSLLRSVVWSGVHLPLYDAAKPRFRRWAGVPE